MERQPVAMRIAGQGLAALCSAGAPMHPVPWSLLGTSTVLPSLTSLCQEGDRVLSYPSEAVATEGSSSGTLCPLDHIRVLQILFWGGQLMALTQLLIPTLFSSDLGAKKTRSNIRAAVDVTVGCLLAPRLGRAVAREEAQGVTVSSPAQDLGSSPWLLSQPAVLLTGAGE